MSYVGNQKTLGIYLEPPLRFRITCSKDVTTLWLLVLSENTFLNSLEDQILQNQCHIHIVFMSDTLNMICLLENTRDTKFNTISNSLYLDFCRIFSVSVQHSLSVCIPSNKSHPLVFTMMAILVSSYLIRKIRLLTIIMFSCYQADWMVQITFSFEVPSII